MVEFRDRWALRPLELSIVDPAVLNDLRVDDPRVCRLDLCLSKSPAMMLQEYCATHLGHFIVQTTDRRIEHDGKRQTEATVTAGSVTATAIDLYAKTARTQAAVNLLCKLNPEVELWRDMMRVNEKQLPKRGAPAIVNGLDEFPLSAGLLLPAQSSTAAQLLKQDRMSMQSHTKRVRDAELANRRADNPDADDGAMVVGDGDGDDDWERRQVPGQGPDFALEWQRQWDLEEKRKEVLGRGDRITNDTLFAFRYDKEREAANGARLAQLRAAFGEFDATPITGAAAEERASDARPRELHAGHRDAVPGARPRRVDGRGVRVGAVARGHAHARSLREDRPRDGRSGRRGAGEPGRRHAGRAHPEQSGDADGRWIDRSFTTS